MMHNELNRRLKDSDPQVHYVLSYLYEAFNEQQKQLNHIADAIALISQMMDAFMKRDEKLHEKMTLIEQFGRTPGVEVSSVAPDPEKGEKS